MHKSGTLNNKVDGAGVFAAGGCKDCNVSPLHPRGPMWSMLSHFLLRSVGLEEQRTCPLSHSLSFFLYLLQVQTCPEPKGYLLFLLKECWI